MFRSRLTFLILTFALLLSSGCVRLHHTRGNFVDPDKLAELKEGMSQEEIVRLLGTPTMLSQFKGNVWLYYGTKESTVAFMNPRIDDSKVVMISFDHTGHATSVEVPNLDRRHVVISSDKTEDLSHRKTFMRSIFGNVGRFNKSSEKVRPRIGGPGY
jgi:outer membrane protein assembly factor BamE (lipoprotein component of BamABCDE complex)